MHAHRTRAPFGTWRSPVSPEVVAGAARRFGRVEFDGDAIWWSESRPAEGGRSVLVRRASEGVAEDVTPAGYNVRSRVHEYGGGEFTVRRGTVYFSNLADQRVYRQTRGGEPVPLTPKLPFRFADFIVDEARGRLLCVREDKRNLNGPEDVNSLVALDAQSDPDGGRVLVSGRDFFASPRMSPSGEWLAWLAWDHPNMPWDAAELWLARVAPEGSLAEPRRVAGGGAESIVQPTWSSGGDLLFGSDRTGYWNLYRLREEKLVARGSAEPDALWPRPAEFGAPQWVFGMSTFAFSTPSTLVCAFAEGGIWRLGRVDLRTEAREVLDLPFTSYAGMASRGDGQVALFAGSFTRATELVLVSTEPCLSWKVLRASSDLEVDSSLVSVPEPLEFASTTRGFEGQAVHAFHYPPRNPAYEGPDSDRPPLIVLVHGGPTSSAASVLSLGGVQFWTSRGFAVVDVNYGGSTGFGRAYRERLRGRWGIVDVDDCEEAARHLIRQGRVDPSRLVISGGSAGGFTVLSAAAFRSTFTAGASYYGIGDLERLAIESRGESPHKFESRYTDGLVAPYPSGVDVYRARSPVRAADRIHCPVIFFQGQDDRVVPPSQAEAMVAALRARGVPVEYHLFEGEGHGFRRAETIQRTHEAALAFYERVLKLRSGEAASRAP